MISADDVIEKQLLSEPWFIYSYFCKLEKIKAHLPSLNYFKKEQISLEKNCTEKMFKHVLSKKKLSESKNAKSLVRAGIPCKYIREFILKHLYVDKPDISFKIKYQLVFKERDSGALGEYVPYFTGYKTLNESLPVEFLNENGIQALKRIMWMLNSVIPDIEFSPLIIKLASFFLVICNEAESYEIMRNILECNYNLDKDKTNKLRWHIRFNFNNNLRIVSSLTEVMGEISKSGKEIFDHLESINFPTEKLYEDMVYGLFFNYLNFEGIARLIPFFLFEGVKALYRLTYALIKTLKNDIFKIKSADDVLKTVREKSKQITDITKLFNMSYTFKLTQYNNNYEFQKIPDRDLFHGRKGSYYLPSFSVTSNILKESEIISMWSNLPFNLKVMDAKMIYNTGKHGYNLLNIYSELITLDVCSDILFIIETMDNHVFAGIMSSTFKHTNLKYERPIQSLLITIRPNFCTYEANKHCDDILYCDNHIFMYGGGVNGPALSIDNDLKNGFSNEPNAFGVPKLGVNGEFTVKKFEIYHLG